MTEDWERVEAVRHKPCGSVVFVAPGSVPHCPMCASEESSALRCVAVIRKVMRRSKRITVYDLKRQTNANRHSADLWSGALNALVSAGEIRIEPGRTWRSRIAVFQTASR
jgi:hypothetical protein